MENGNKTNLPNKLKFSELEKIAPYRGYETGGYITATAEIMLVRSSREAEDSYRMDPKERTRAKRKGGMIAIHTHPQPVDGPSDVDMGIARRYRGKTFAVWEVKNAKAYFYNHTGVIDVQHIRYRCGFGYCQKFCGKPGTVPGFFVRILELPNGH
ncbi:MAG: hypothetical protein N3A60_08950 [Thermanaerothrix sp.]|nr:hypothetical protein [Thermanaerothrix sp.]